MTLLNNIINYKIGSDKFSWLRKLYLKISDYEIKYVLRREKASTLFFYSEELRDRPEFRELILSVVSKLDNCNFLMCKRIVNFKINRNIENQLVSTADKIDLNGIDKIVIFCPHLMLDYSVLIKAKKSNIQTICMQHGYYSFNDDEYNLFKKMTSCDIALQYDHRSDDFFSNCKDRIYVGQYAKCGELDPIVVNGGMIYLPYVNATNLSYVIGLVEKITSEILCNYTIRLHPRQDTKVFKKICSKKIDFKKIKKLPSNVIGEVNFYIETTAWTLINGNLNLQKNFLIRNGVMEEINKASYPSTDRLLQAIKRLNHAEICRDKCH